MTPSRRSAKILVLSSRAPQLGASVAEIDWRPALSIVPRLHDMKVKLLELARFRAVVFTSVHAVEVFVAALRSIDKDGRALAGLRLAAVGGETAAALRQRLLEPDLVGDGGGAALAQALIDAHWSGPVLFPRGKEGRDELPTALTAAGIAVEVVTAYDAILDDEQLRAALAVHRELPYAAVALGSPRIATRWLALGGPHELPCGVLGATTAEVLHAAGIEPIVAPLPSLESLVATLAQSFTAASQIE